MKPPGPAGGGGGPVFAVQVSTTTQVFAAAYVGATAPGSVMLTATRHNKNVSITVTGDFSTTVSATRKIPPGGLQVPLLFSPTSATVCTGELKVSWSSGEVTCALEGTGLAPTAPSLANSSAHDFATIAVGATAAAPFPLLNPARTDNPADEPCTATATIGGGHTVSPSGPQTVPEGGTQVFTVTFAPTAAQAYPTRLNIAWQRAGLSGTLGVDVTGTGFVPVPTPPPPAPTPPPTDPPPTSTNAAGSTRKRASWYVPTYESYVSLGEAWTPTGTSTRTQSGFSATTTRHVFMRAAGSVTFQSVNGPLWLQSENGPLYSVSGEGTYMVAKSTLWVGAGGYVGVMAGYAGEPIPSGEVANYNDGDPSRPAPIDKIPPAFLTADLVWGIAEKIVGIASVAKMVEHFVYLGKHNETIARVAMGLSVASQAIGLTSFIVGKAMGMPAKTLNFFSQAGILAGTPAFCSIYGSMGVNYRSANITLLGNIAVAVNSIVASTLDSLFGDTAVASSKVNATSWMGLYLYSTLGKSSILGWEIGLGGVTPDGMQLPTAEMELESIATVEIGTNGPASKIALKARTLAPWPDAIPILKMNSTTDVVLEAPKTTIRLNKGPGVVAFTIEASPTGISIKNSKQEEVLNLADAKITLGPIGGQIVLTAANTTIGGGAMVISDAQMAVSGFGDLL